jgi:hypothetical protein
VEPFCAVRVHSSCGSLYRPPRAENLILKMGVLNEFLG